MSWKSILVPIKPDRPTGVYLDVAVDFARRFDARLRLVLSLRDLAMLRLLFSERDPALVQKRTREAIEEASATEQAVRETLAPRGVEFEWYLAEGDPALVTVLAGRAADLVVLEQTVPGAYESGSNVAEESVLMTGTPTLVVPHSMKTTPVCRRPLIAWNGSREASGALNAAMPLIDTAESVVLLKGESREQFTAVTRRPGFDVEDRLRRHTSRLEVLPFNPTRGPDGAELLDTARDQGCDVIIMGAYGRSRTRQWLLGGVTRHALAYMDRPVLFGR